MHSQLIAWPKTAHKHGGGGRYSEIPTGCNVINSGSLGLHAVPTVRFINWLSTPNLIAYVVFLPYPTSPSYIYLDAARCVAKLLRWWPTGIFQRFDLPVPCPRDWRYLPKTVSGWAHLAELFLSQFCFWLVFDE